MPYAMFPGDEDDEFEETRARPMFDDEAYETFEKVKCIKETDKALLCTGLGDKECWVPKSQVSEDSEVFADGHEGTLIVTNWWADKAGLA